MAQVPSEYAGQAVSAGDSENGSHSLVCVGFHGLLVGRLGSQPLIDAGLQWPAFEGAYFKPGEVAAVHGDTLGDHAALLTAAGS